MEEGDFVKMNVYFITRCNPTGQGIIENEKSIHNRCPMWRRRDFVVEYTKLGISTIGIRYG